MTVFERNIPDRNEEGYNESIPFDRIASAPIVYVENNVSFIIKIREIIKVDLFAGMKRNRTRTFYYRKSNQMH